MQKRWPHNDPIPVKVKICTGTINFNQNRVWGIRFRFSGSGLRVSGSGVRGSGFEFRVSGFGFQISGFGVGVSGLGFLVSGSGKTREVEEEVHVDGQSDGQSGGQTVRSDRTRRLAPASLMWILIYIKTVQS